MSAPTGLPGGLLRYMLKRLLPGDLRGEAILGDLEEEFRALAERSSPRRDSNRCVKPCTSENPCSWSRRQGTWSSITMRATLSPPGGACSRTTSIRACSSRIGPTERP